MAYEVDDYTVSLLHCDDGITDETGKVWTSSGSVSVSNDEKQLGTGSLFFNDGILTFTDGNQDFVFGTNDFTIECYIYITKESVTYGMPIIGNYTYSADGYTGHAGWSLVVNRSYSDAYGPYGLCFGNFNSSGTATIYMKYTAMLTTNTWHHIAVVRNQESFYMFLDGILVKTLTSSVAIDAPKTYAYIGNYNNQNGNLYTGTAFYGYIDELRISNIARWTSDFIPGELSAPTLTATSQVTLSWATVTDATSYNVKRASTSGGEYTTIASGVTDTIYVDTDIESGTTYYYVVTAVNSDTESSSSNENSVAITIS